MDRLWFLALVLLLLVLACAPALVDGLSGDDYVHVYKNRGPVSAWADYFLRADGREYRPVVRLSLALDHLAWGKNYAGYHLTNLLLHVLVCALLFVYADELRVNRRAALIAVLIFALHPIHSYSINAVMGRTDILCALFALGALVAAGRGKMLAAGLLCSLCLLSKELGLVLPVFFALQLLFVRPLRTARTYRILGLLAALDIAYLLGRLLIIPPDPSDLAVYFSASPTGLLRNVVYYAGGLLLPIGHYQLREAGELHPFVLLILAGAGILGLSTYAWQRLHRFLSPDVGFGMLWVVVSLAPVAFLFQRRFLYLASVGFALLAGSLLARLGGRRTVSAIAIALALVLGLSLFAKAREWGEVAPEGRAVIARLVEIYRTSKPGRLYALNVPHSRGDAHLFTHESLRFAVGLELDHLPAITPVTRVRLGKQPVQVKATQQRIVSRVVPGPDQYFVFDAPESLPSGGRILPLGRAFSKGPFTIRITGVDSEGRVAEVTVEWSELRPGEAWILL